jgi:hypothetical protein
MQSVLANPWGVVCTCDFPNGRPTEPAGWCCFGRGELISVRGGSNDNEPSLHERKIKARFPGTDEDGKLLGVSIHGY